MDEKQVKDLLQTSEQKVVLICTRLIELQKQLNAKVDVLQKRIEGLEGRLNTMGPKIKRQRGYKDWKYVIDMHQKGYALKDIAATSGIPYSTVCAYVHMDEEDALNLPGSNGIVLPPVHDRPEAAEAHND